MDPFDFRLYVDPSTLSGTQYFELLPGKYAGTCWNPQSRFIDECTFSLFEGIIEKHVPSHSHWTFGEAARPAWELILLDLTSLQATLEDKDRRSPVSLPYGRALRVQTNFEESWGTNEKALAILITEMNQWLRETLKEHEIISILGI
jgi:hypothetical protein